MNYLTPEQAGAQLGVTKKTVYKWLASGALSAGRAGHRWLITQEDIDIFVNRGTSVPGVDPVARFDGSLPDFMRSTDAVIDAAKAAAAATGGRDVALMDAVLDAARALRRSLDAWSAADPRGPGRAS